MGNGQWSMLARPVAWQGRGEWPTGNGVCLPALGDSKGVVNGQRQWSMLARPVA
ncbi:hypothetical protein [Longitalea arenae]|uniref:hypothetical protein n=1 Tax=Longitalea arenae TaxID=2812558 RepID=UPI0019670DD3|nr:hypothetical protein [Longitalea arenae]